MKNNNFILYLHHRGLGHPGLEKVIHLPLLHLKIKKSNKIMKMKETFAANGLKRTDGLWPCKGECSV